MLNLHKRLTLIPALVIALFMTACTAHQQDALLNKVTELGREKAGLVKSQAHTDDIDMVYLERQGTGPVVMMVHGFSANKDTWLRFADALPENYRLIAPDLAGHGQSALAESYDLEAQADRLHALASILRLSEFHIVGNSMGGAISVIYASKYPEQIRSLTLIDAAGLDGDTKSDYYKMLEQGSNPLIATDKESFEFRMDMVMEQPPALPWPLRPALTRQTIARADLNREIFADMIATRERLPVDTFGPLISANVTMPTLIMWGAEDRVLDVSAVETFKTYIPQAEVSIFEGIGHVPMLEIPDESAAVLTEFISKID